MSIEEVEREGGTSSGLAGDEKVLVARARAHEGAAFEALFRKYREKIYRMTYGWCLDSEVAMDLTQDVFLKAFRSIGSFKEDSSFYTWLCRIALNRCMDYCRQKRKHKEVYLEEAVQEGAQNEEEAPSRAAQIDELKRDLRKAIDKLSEEARAAFMLRFFEGLTYKEIADALECSIGTVMSRIFYARQRLRELLKEHL